MRVPSRVIAALTAVLALAACSAGQKFKVDSLTASQESTVAKMTANDPGLAALSRLGYKTPQNVEYQGKGAWLDYRLCQSNVPHLACSLVVTIERPAVLVSLTSRPGANGEITLTGKYRLAYPDPQKRTGWALMCVPTRYASSVPSPARGGKLGGVRGSGLDASVPSEFASTGAAASELTYAGSRPETLHTSNGDAWTCKRVVFSV